MEIPAKTHISSVCALGPAVEKISGLKSNSASPTDTWLVKFKPGVAVEGHAVRNGFLKIFIDPGSLPPSIASAQQFALLLGLDYELNVYTEVTNKLLHFHISPTYVWAVGAGRGCSYADLVNLLRGHIYERGTSRLLSETQTLDVLDRNLYYTLKQEPDRPAIDNTKEPSYGHGELFSTLKYSMILSESAGDAMTLSTWVKSSRFNNTDFWKIMFLTCVGCYGMSLSRMTHNDIHTGNVFIKDLGEVQQFVFSINGTPILISSRYMPLIYDYDRAYVKHLGENYLNKHFHNNFCELYSQCNIFVPNKDMIKVFCYLYRGLPSLRATILDVLTSGRAKQKLREVYSVEEDSCFLQEQNRLTGDVFAMPIEDYALMNDCVTIIFNVFKLIPTEPANYDLDKWGFKNIYCINKANFKRDGEVDIFKQNKELNYILATLRSMPTKPETKSVTRISSVPRGMSVDKSKISRSPTPSRRKSLTKKSRVRKTKKSEISHSPPWKTPSRKKSLTKKSRVRTSPRAARRKSASPRKEKVHGRS